MHRFPRTFATLVVAGTLLIGVAACGSDSSDGSTTTVATTAVGDVSGAPDGSSMPDDTTEATEPDTGSAGTGTVTLADGEADAAHTLTFSADGGWSPTGLEVPVGEKFTVKAGDDGTYAAAFGESTDTYTFTGGLIETFTIDAAGTYELREDLSGKTATITVTG